MRRIKQLALSEAASRMRLSTSKGEDTITYRGHRIPIFHVSREEYFGEACEHLAAGGVRVQQVLPDDYFDGLEW